MHGTNNIYSLKPQNGHESNFRMNQRIQVLKTGSELSRLRTGLCSHLHNLMLQDPFQYYLHV
jgi:hypothetical protein